MTVADERMIKQEMSEWKRQKEKTGMMAMNEETQDEKKHWLKGIPCTNLFPQQNLWREREESFLS